MTLAGLPAKARPGVVDFPAPWAALSKGKPTGGGTDVSMGLSPDDGWG
jgi:hypothetical protein